MAHFCWLLKLSFLLLMMSGCRTRPAPLPGGRQSEIIAGNEFLKLFLDHDDQQRSLHSGEQEFEGRGESANPRQRMATGRSLNISRSRFRNSLSNGNGQEAPEKDARQVVKLVTTGSKIVFLEDLPKAVKGKPSDEVKVVAVSVSSSSKRGPSTATGSGKDFVNRSHKSELSIEETEPRLGGDAMDGGGEVDSQNSASSIQSVLAAPLLAASASSKHSFIKNQSEVSEEGTGTGTETGTGAGAGLPFQTVIYHDTKQGRGPQSRSISYSSISQNVDDLQAWQQSRSGILAEAQRNVSESLKHGHASEPAKFYSVPSKMYSVPSKFYSEPAKVYSEPSKMYGQPEKVYSEPSKVYGQPSKFYSEPAKVYSQPAKVYGEPAKTYWPQSVTSSTSTTTTAPPLGSSTLHGGFSTTSSGSSTTTESPPVAATTFVPPRSRPRPAIVSRIAFGEAQSTTTTVAATAATSGSTTTPAAVAGRVTTVRPASSTVKPTTWQHHYHSYNHQQQQQQQQQAHPTRRVLFNLDKLPYDLLNAPQPHLLEPILSKHSSPSYNHQQHQQQQQQQHPCWEQRQHSSLPHQHSNQNAKGLPNRDLVKCISKFAHQHGASASASAPASPVDPSATSTGTGYSYSSSSSSSTSSSSSSSTSLRTQQQPQHQQHFTTERPELYTPTSEQNYEIEESVSVMTNGRAHGLQGGGAGSGSGVGAGAGGAVATTPVSPTTTTSAASGRGINRGRGSVVYNANANDYSDGTETEGESDGGGSDSADEDEDKVAYVVEGRNYRKYRVEEKTDDGFIVGEYGVVDHNDGNLWGVRYTADSTINRSLIQKALLTFLKLK
ncbi:hypothetical protein KR018_009085 [Drosophila ironensis]|nr:hypothetical protein KR018_009085 [Drosophila ironensis]